TGGTGTVTYALFGADLSGRYVIGGTSDDLSDRLWGVDTNTGLTSQIGLYGDGIHEVNEPAVIFGPLLNTAGLMVGMAERNDGVITGLGEPSVSSWVSDLKTGITHQIGLYDTAHELPNSLPDATGPAYFNIGLHATNSGHVLGVAINGTSNTDPGLIANDAIGLGYGLPFISDSYGQSVWMAEAGTGATTRFGLTDAEHTMPAVMDGLTELSPGGYQASTIVAAGFFYVEGINEQGFLAGISMQFGSVIDEHLGDGPKVHAGVSLWVGDTSNGKTYQVGLTDAGHTSATGTRDAIFVPIEYDGSSAAAMDAPSLVTAEGFVAGNSASFPAVGDPGSSAWVAKYDSGTDAYITTRLGFFGGEADGRYEDANGMEWSEATHFTQTGLVGGFSTMLDNSDYLDTMQSAWVVDAHDLIRVEVGLLDTAYTLGDGYHQTTIGGLTNAGLVAGESTLFGAALDRSEDERVTWVQKVSSSTDATTMVAERIGLTTLSDSTARVSTIEGVTQSGIVDGSTSQTLASGGDAGDTWVAYLDGAHFTTDQIGLIGPDYSKPVAGDRYSEVAAMLESGVALGITKRYYTPDAGTTYEKKDATWIATRQPSASYVTTRVGLFDAFHTGADGRQASSFEPYALTNSGYVGGYSTNYGTTGATGNSAWVVDASDAITRQVGATDLRHTMADGTQNSLINGITESG
ncbi:MAG TPA: hypothetical protein VK968_06460, partial [Roseimicrobium sp.]|nr:hypothetical protein [Roseimicrobium sp.]